MPNIDHPRVIEGDPRESAKLEKRHRYSHLLLFHRVRMLGLLESEVCANNPWGKRPRGFGLRSRRRCRRRRFIAYGRGGLEELLVSRVHERGPKKGLATEEAFGEPEEAMKAGEIATVARAHRFLRGRGTRYAHPESAGGLLGRRKVKPKTRPASAREGRPTGAAGGIQKRFARKVVAHSGEREHSDEPLKVMAFADEARFGLINRHRKRYRPRGFRPPCVVRRAYGWTHLYAAVAPARAGRAPVYTSAGHGRPSSGEAFLKGLGEAYADHHLLLLVLDGAPSPTPPAGSSNRRT